MLVTHENEKKPSNTTGKGARQVAPPLTGRNCTSTKRSGHSEDKLYLRTDPGVIGDSLGYAGGDVQTWSF
jgi:hypothetical protein